MHHGQGKVCTKFEFIWSICMARRSIPCSGVIYIVCKWYWSDVYNSVDLVIAHLWLLRGNGFYKANWAISESLVAFPGKWAAQLVTRDSEIAQLALQKPFPRKSHKWAITKTTELYTSLQYNLHTMYITPEHGMGPSGPRRCIGPFGPDLSKLYIVEGLAGTGMHYMCMII